MGEGQKGLEVNTCETNANILYWSEFSVSDSVFF